MFYLFIKDSTYFHGRHQCVCVCAHTHTHIDGGRGNMLNL